MSKVVVRCKSPRDRVAANQLLSRAKQHGAKITVTPKGAFELEVEGDDILLERMLGRFITRGPVPS